MIDIITSDLHSTDGIDKDISILVQYVVIGPVHLEFLISRQPRILTRMRAVYRSRAQ